MIKNIWQFISWGLSVIVIGIITSLLAQYLKPRIDKFLAKHSSKRRAILEAKRERHEKYIFSLLEDRQKIIELKLDKLDLVWKTVLCLCYSFFVGTTLILLAGTIIDRVLGIIFTSMGLFGVIRCGSKLFKLERLISDLNDIEKDHFNRGNTLCKLGRYEKAIKAYEKAIELNPDYAMAWYNKGNTLCKLGRCEEALKSYDKAIELKQDYADAWNNKGVALYKLGRNEEALKSYDKVIELKPDDAVAWYNKGGAHSQMGDKRNALENLSRAIELDAKLKEEVKKDKGFKNLWDDEDFKRITR